MIFRKDERLCGKKDIDSLFTRGGSRSMSAFPLRLVYAMSHADGCKPGARMLVSVPKRCFKRAVKRNRVKDKCARPIGRIRTSFTGVLTHSAALS